MFTGIVTALGTVRAVERRRGGARIEIAPPAGEARYRAGESVCVSGVCLTAVEPGRRLVADLSEETLRRSTLRDARARRSGQPRAGPSLGRPALGALRHGTRRRHLARALDPPGRQFVDLPLLDPARASAASSAVKGSVALDGVSLTVAAPDGEAPSASRSSPRHSAGRRSAACARETASISRPTSSRGTAAAARSRRFARARAAR